MSTNSDFPFYESESGTWIAVNYPSRCLGGRPVSMNYDDALAGVNEKAWSDERTLQLRYLSLHSLLNEPCKPPNRRHNKRSAQRPFLLPRRRAKRIARGNRLLLLFSKFDPPHQEAVSSKRIRMLEPLFVRLLKKKPYIVCARLATQECHFIQHIAPTAHSY